MLKAYIYEFLVEVVRIVAVLHEDDEFLLVFGVFVQFNDIVMLKACVDDAFFSGEVDTKIVHQFRLLYLLLNNCLKMQNRVRIV